MAKEPRTVLPGADGIREHWDLPALNRLEPLRGGYHTVLLRSGDVVVCIEERDPKSVRWEHELLSWLRPVVPGAPAPIAARDGSTFLVVEDHVVSLLPFVDGEPHGGLAAAELLARVHVRGSTWPQARPRPGRPAALELAAAAWSFAEDDPRSFVSAYLDAGGPGEPEAFAEGTRIVVLANALYALTRSGENRDWVEYLLARLRDLG